MDNQVCKGCQIVCCDGACDTEGEVTGLLADCSNVSGGAVIDTCSPTYQIATSFGPDSPFSLLEQIIFLPEYACANFSHDTTTSGAEPAANEGTISTTSGGEETATPNPISTTLAEQKQ